MNKQIRGSACLILATVFWGTTFVAQSVGMDHVGPITFQAIRCLIGALFLLPATLLTDRMQHHSKSFRQQWTDKKLWKAGFLCGIPLFIACNLQQVGIVDTDPGKAAFLTAMYIVIVPIIDFFRKKKTSPLVPLSVLLAVGGLYCLSCIGVTSILPSDLLLLGCALAFAVQITFVDMFALEFDGIRVNAIQALTCSVLSGVLAVFTEEISWQGILDCWFPLVYAGVLSMGTAYSLQIIGQKDLSPSVASLVMSLESVVAVLSGWIILGDVLTTWEFLGCVLIFAAILLSQVTFPARKKA